MLTVSRRRTRVEPIRPSNTAYQQWIAKRLHCGMLPPFWCAVCRGLSIDPLGWNGPHKPLCEECSDPVRPPWKGELWEFEPGKAPKLAKEVRS